MKTNKIITGIFLACIFLGINACNYTKNLTQGQYLLDKASIENDNKKIATDDLADYMVQQPNVSFLGMKPGLAIYNWAGKDSTFFNKILWKIGSAPVIYNASNSSYSARQMQQQLYNWGYMNAKVDFTEELSDEKKKASVTYRLHPGTPYTIRSFNINVQDSAIYKILERSLRQDPVKVNGIFDQDVLGEKLGTLSTALRNRGYFTFGAEYLQYLVDSTLNNHEVDLSLIMLPRRTEDAEGNTIEEKHGVYKIDNINIYSGSTMSGSRNRRNYIMTDTTKAANTYIHYDRNRFLNERTLLERSTIRSGRNYSERMVERTHQGLSSLTAVKQVTMDFTEKAGNLLDCNIHVIPGNIHWIQGTIEGTNSAGDLGVASTVSYQHRNIFNGAEVFRVKLRGAYEVVSGNSSDILNDNYYEYGIETGLSFPRFLVKIPHLRERQGSTDIKLSINNQLRAEYQRIFFNTGIAYKWTTDRNRLNHSWDIFDLNYIAMPRVSKYFQENVMDNPDNSILRYSYENQFILRTSYGLVFNMQKRGAKTSEYQTLRTNIEFAGNALYGLSKLANLKQDENGRYQIFNNPFAQYVKADADFVKSIYVNSRAALVLHSSLGVAYPYQNSVVLPYEKRYFSGGSNSLRGWNTRELGPGSYDNKGVTDFMNQSGDIKIDLNAEFRYNIGGSMFQVAAFYDAGNIWTIREYENQPGGLFKWNQFYKEIAMSTGLGLRLDFGFFLIRVDGGLKVFDPAESGSDCWRILKPKFSRDVAFHFAIGYPF